jgi:DHA1 family bicyclomycin/chloramphenicol resistance-like MFS transporter
VLLLSLALFGLASLAAAGADGGAGFIAARLLQGVGASGPHLARKLSYLSFAFVSALGGGQFLGGLMQQYASWQAEFFLLAAIGAALAALALLTPIPACCWAWRIVAARCW